MAGGRVSARGGQDHSTRTSRSVSSRIPRVTPCPSCSRDVTRGRKLGRDDAVARARFPVRGILRKPAEPLQLQHRERSGPVDPREVISEGATVWPGVRWGSTPAPAATSPPISPSYLLSLSFGGVQSRPTASAPVTLPSSPARASDPQAQLYNITPGIRYTPAHIARLLWNYSESALDKDRRLIERAYRGPANQRPYRSISHNPRVTFMIRLSRVCSRYSCSMRLGILYPGSKLTRDHQSE